MVMLTARVLNLAALAFTREPGCLPACLPACPPACLPACLICRRSCFCCAPRCICLAICAATRAAAAASHAQQTELFTRLPACRALPCHPAVAMSAVLLLYVNWGGLQAECLKRDTCDIWEVRVAGRPAGWSRAGGVLGLNGGPSGQVLLVAEEWRCGNGRHASGVAETDTSCQLSRPPTATHPLSPTLAHSRRPPCASTRWLRGQQPGLRWQSST